MRVLIVYVCWYLPTSDIELIEVDIHKLHYIQLYKKLSISKCKCKKASDRYLSEISFNTKGKIRFSISLASLS